MQCSSVLRCLTFMTAIRLRDMVVQSLLRIYLNRRCRLLSWYGGQISRVVDSSAGDHKYLGLIWSGLAWGLVGRNTRAADRDWWHERALIESDVRRMKLYLPSATQPMNEVRSYTTEKKWRRIASHRNRLDFSQTRRESAAFGRPTVLRCNAQTLFL